MIINEEKRHHIMSYIVYAGEILKKDGRLPKKSYKYIYIPSGPELYTGSLKSVGYLFLEKNIKHIIFFVEQNEYPEDLIFYNNSQDLLIWGKKIKNKDFFDSKYTKKIPEELFEQILFLRLLTKTRSITIIGIGNKYSKTKLINKIKKDYGIVFLGNMAKEKTIKKSKEEDNKMIESFIKKKEYKNNTDWLGNIYIKITKKQNKKSELIIYVNTSDLGIKINNPIGFSCVVS